jgi:hypothetical protein
MMDPIANPRDAVAFLLRHKTVVEVAKKLTSETSEDRSRVRGWNSGSVGIGRSKAKMIATFASTVALDECGMPLINWKLAEEQYLRELREADALDEENSKARYLALYKDPGVLRFATLDVGENPGLTCEDTVRCALLNLIGMHLARRVAQTHPKSQWLDSTGLVHLALRRAMTACNLLQHARIGQLQVGSLWTAKELSVLWLYARLNQLAILSTFRVSRAKITGFWVFDDGAAWAYVDDALVKQFAEFLSVYRKGHPVWMIVASNTFVAASIAKRKPVANQAWLAMIDENPIATDLSKTLPGDARPLADSPDLVWLKAVNGGWIYNPATFEEEPPS